MRELTSVESHAIAGADCCCPCQQRQSFDYNKYREETMRDGAFRDSILITGFYVGAVVMTISSPFVAAGLVISGAPIVQSLAESFAYSYQDPDALW